MQNDHGPSNLAALFGQADDIDRAEGRLAYARYHTVLCGLAHRYEVPLRRVCAAFVSLSPNNDYIGNVRSVMGVLAAVRDGRAVDTAIVSTYGHCRARAYAYAAGSEDFEARRRGPKITNFYHNILDPDDPRYVTIDGHMIGAWRGLPVVMKEARCTLVQYREMHHAVTELAKNVGLVPCQYQATVWFTRKRILKRKYTPQLTLFQRQDDAWGSLVNLDELTPYAAAIGNTDQGAGADGPAHPERADTAPRQGSFIDSLA